MMMSGIFFAAALTIFPSLAASTAYGQYGFHVDHHDHVIRDSHGHVIGRYHHDVIHHDAQHIVPHMDNVNHGTYYRHNGHSYYHPQTAMLGTLQAPPTPQEITFGGYGHVDDLAMRLETLMNELCLDLYYNQIGTLGIISKMDMAESVLHHLMQDVGVKPEIIEQAPAPSVGGPELAPPPITFQPQQ